MKTGKSLILLVCCATLLFTFAPRSAKADGGASFSYFYDSLDPYGEWVEVPNYGYCWHPSGVNEEWEPYTDGYWAYTDAGWTWVSYEDWGGITYHYGRWTRLHDFGWCWVPGYEWGPAWVSWRSNDDYIGWAPLPPEVVFESANGIGISVDVSYGIGPRWYHFCHYHDFGAPAIRPFIVVRSMNFELIGRTRNITNITVNTGRHLVFNGGPDYRMVQQRSARPIPTLKLVQQTDVGAARASSGGLFAKQHGNQLEVFAPIITRPSGGQSARPKTIGKAVENVAVDKGWSGVSDSQANQLRNNLKQQTGEVSPEKMHARPVTEQELKFVSENNGNKSGSQQPVLKGGKLQPAIVPATPVPQQPANEQTRHDQNTRPAPQPGTLQPIDEHRSQSQKTPVIQKDLPPVDKTLENQHQQEIQHRKDLQRQQLQQQEQNQQKAQRQDPATLVPQQPPIEQTRHDQNTRPATQPGTLQPFEEHRPQGQRPPVIQKDLPSVDKTVENQRQQEIQHQRDLQRQQWQQQQQQRPQETTRQLQPKPVDSGRTPPQRAEQPQAQRQAPPQNESRSGGDKGKGKPTASPSPGQ